MGHDIRLTDPVTRETLHTDSPHQMGGRYHMYGRNHRDVAQCHLQLQRAL